LRWWQRALREWASLVRDEIAHITEPQPEQKTEWTAKCEYPTFSNTVDGQIDSHNAQDVFVHPPTPLANGELEYQKPQCREE
jgi:hypothetical protein